MKRYTIQQRVEIISCV